MVFRKIFDIVRQSGNSQDYFKTFVSKDQDFSSRSNSLRLWQFCWWSLWFFILIASIYGFIYHEGPSSRRFIGRAWDGISEMSIEVFLIVIVASILIAILGVVLTVVYFNHRRIIVELNFDDTAGQLTVKSKTIRDRQNTQTFNYKDVRFSPNYLSDGMSITMYNVFTLSKNDDYVVGHIFRNHFTWTQQEVDEIRGKLLREVQH